MSLETSSPTPIIPLTRAAKDLQAGDTFTHYHHEVPHVLVVESVSEVDSPIGTKWARIVAVTNGRRGYVEYGTDHPITVTAVGANA